VTLSSYKKLKIDGIELKKLEINGILAWKAGYTNLVPLSTEEDGVTIYNGGLGYKDGYRVRSGGAEQTISTGTCTGYIPYKKGDRLYIYKPFVGRNSDNAVNFFDSSFNCLGQITDNGSAYGFCNSTFKTKVENGVSVLDLSAVTVSGVANVAFVRITNLIKYGGSSMSSGAEMIITKNEEIEL
jgi:hypothetical protein